MNWTERIVAIVTVAIGLARPMLPTHELSPGGGYEAGAHVFVGALIGAWLAGGGPFYRAAAACLITVELICFFASRL